MPFRALVPTLLLALLALLAPGRQCAHSQTEGGESDTLMWLADVTDLSVLEDMLRNPAVEAAALRHLATGPCVGLSFAQVSRTPSGDREYLATLVSREVATNIEHRLEVEYEYTAPAAGAAPFVPGVLSVFEQTREYSGAVTGEIIPDALSYRFLAHVLRNERSLLLREMRRFAISGVRVQPVVGPSGPIAIRLHVELTRGRSIRRLQYIADVFPGETFGRLRLR